MLRGKEGTAGVPSYSEVLRAPVFLPVFLTATLSTWGDYIARITVAAVVFAWTGSALATAATFAVSLVPSILGRALLSPWCDRVAPRTALVATHLIRAGLVGGLVMAVATTRSVPLVLGLVFLLEFVGGPAITSSQMLLTDLFPDRRLFARAFGLWTLATQVNQAIGLALGGAVVGLVGESSALVIDLVTFLVGAAVLAVVVPPTSRVEPGEAQLASLAGDLKRGWHEIRSSRVLTLLLLLSLASALAMAAPEAVALPYASDHSGSSTWGGLLMAAPILGAVVGLLLIGRLPAERQSRLVMRLALLMPIPLLVTVVEPHLLVVWVAWFVCGALQSYMLPLQSAFTLLVPTALRGRVFGLAGALSVGVTGVCFLVAGWISEHTSPAASVGICAVVTLGVLVLLAARWPREEISSAVAETFRSEPQEPVVAEAAPPSLSADGVAGPAEDADGGEGLELPDAFDEELVEAFEPDLVDDLDRPVGHAVTARSSGRSEGRAPDRPGGRATPPGG
jgi:MFS family permease